MREEKSKAIELLRQIGLNQLEAEVYAFLLPSEPMTAYAIGTALGKPTANVYKAIERLARQAVRDCSTSSARCPGRFATRTS
jgi:sugar-specific transcriptional regulator TrmB